MRYLFAFVTIIILCISCKPKSPLKIKVFKPSVFSSSIASFHFFKLDKHLKQSKKDKTIFLGDTISLNKKIKAIYTNFYEIQFGKMILEKIGYSSVELFNKDGQIERKFMSFHTADTSIRKINPKKSDLKGDVSFSNLSVKSNTRNNSYTAIIPYQKHIRTKYFYDKNRRLAYIDLEIRPSIPLKDPSQYTYNILMFDYTMAKKGFVNLYFRQFLFPFDQFAMPVEFDTLSKSITNDIGIELYPEPFNTNQLLIHPTKKSGEYFRQYITYYN